MSTPPPRRPRPPGPMRQQLDELDALLERMLALPVSAGDEPASVAAAEGPAAPSSATVPPPPEPPRPAVLATVMVPQGVPPAASAVPGSAVMPPLPAGRRPPPGTRPSLPLFRPAPRTPRWLLPLVLLNRVYDRLTMRLGTPGRWLRHSAARTVFGWTGLLMLVAAIAVAVFDWFGWPW